MSDINDTILESYILRFSSGYVLNGLLRFCDINCKEDLVFDNITIYKTITIFGNNHEHRIEKYIHNVAGLMEQILFVYETDEYSEDTDPFQKIIIRKLNDNHELDTNIAIVNFIEYTNNILYAEISNI